MGKNLGELDNVRIMRNSIEQLTDAYVNVRNVMPNDVMESLMKYNVDLEILEKNLKKQFEDLKKNA